MIAKGFLSYGHVGDIYSDGPLAIFGNELAAEVELVAGQVFELNMDTSFGDWRLNEPSKRMLLSQLHFFFISNSNRGISSK